MSSSSTPDHPHNPAAGAWVEGWLSAERFATYVTESAADRSVALQLYEWNSIMSAAVLHDLGHLEVAVRNAYDAVLTEHQRGPLHWTRDADWYFPVKWGRAADRTLVDQNRTPRSQLERAVHDAGGTRAPDGKVIAQLGFGFWRYLTVSRRERDLWPPHLRHAFVPGTSRPEIDKPMTRLHGLRNRVAHHEHLLRTDLTRHRADLMAVVGAISPELLRHIEASSSWSEVQAQRPASASPN